MDEHRHMPDVNQLSVLMATILLAYALTPFIKDNGSQIAFSISGVFFSFQLNFNTVVSVMVAMLAAAGTGWLLQGHPRARRTPFEAHRWILPALTAWAIGIPLTSLKVGLAWWGVFSLGGFLLVLILISEYIVVDPEDIRHAPAGMGLTAVSFALYLVLAIAVHGSGLRLYLLVFTLIPSLFMVSWRALILRTNGNAPLAWSAAIAILVGQMAAGLHYLPVSSIRFGLLLTGTAYGLTAIAGNMSERQRGLWLWLEPVLMTVLLFILAFWLG